MHENAARTAVAASTAPENPFLALSPALLELLPVAIYACDRDGHLLWFNRRALGLWGRSPRAGVDGERFCGAHALFIDERPVDGGESPMAEVLATGEPIDEVDAEIERPDGSRRRVTAQFAPVRAADGSLAGAICCLTDTTESHRADQFALSRARRAGRAAIKAQEDLRGVLDVVPAAIYTTDARGCVDYFNQAAVDLVGRVPQLGVDRWCVSWRLYRPDGSPLPHAECPMAEALKQGAPIRDAEIIAERPDGIRVPLIANPTPLRDADNRISGAVNMLLDISARRHAETQQRLMLDELNHRIKNNMHMLHSLLSAARSETGDGEGRAALADASQRVAAMAAAQRVLYASRNPAQFSAKDFLEVVCRTTQQASAGPAVHRDDTAARVANDKAVPLALILNELLTNAFKYGQGDRPNGTVLAGLVDGEDGCELYVEDDGPGFELGKVRRRASGLGLVSGLARQLGGRFSVERTPRTRCVVRFPA